MNSVNEPQSDFDRFDGYIRSSGDVGVRNHVLVIPSVICSHIVSDRIAAATDGAVSLPHDHGCAQIGDDHGQTERTLLELARNPNVAGALVVGLGCEHLQSAPFADRVAKLGVPTEEISIQRVGGTRKCIDEGTRLATTLIEDHGSDTRDPASIADLTIGIISSDLTKSTIHHANPLVGKAVNQLVSMGARVVVAGTERLVPHQTATIERAHSPTVADELNTVIDDLSDTPANSRSLISIANRRPYSEVVGHWGTQPVMSVVEYGNRAEGAAGLHILDSSSRFEEAATGLVSAGASVVLHVTGEGIPTGHPVAPVLKLSASESILESMGQDMDIDATTTDVHGLLSTIGRVAGGKPVASERHGLTAFAISRIGPSM